MPKRVLLAALKKESNTFVPGLVGLDELRRQRVAAADPTPTP
ncbi:MAG: hypothetical protein ACYC1C_17595 [Chloroflexota bacterium]